MLGQDLPEIDTHSTVNQNYYSSSKISETSNNQPNLATTASASISGTLRQISSTTIAVDKT